SKLSSYIPVQYFIETEEVQVKGMGKNVF
ncbi:hypothetical protein SAMN04487865_100490, partial [Succinivibrio dextrinosolvens]